MPADPAHVRLVNGVLLPGFIGTSPPDWLRRALDDDLAGVLYFAHNIPSVDDTRELSDQIRQQSPAAIIAADEEGGDVTRLEAATGSSVPGNAALGAVDDEDLTHAVAAEVAALLRRAGIGLDLAPTVDVNSNPLNAGIGVRSFGADPVLVARHGAAFVTGMQSGGVAACVKHFPGHGDTAVDSHFGLPIIDVDPTLLRERDVEPFAAAIKAGVKTLMAGHIVVPAFGELPASLSPSLTALARDELGFDGVIVTDALDMEGAKGGRGLGGAAVLAARAGVDLLCLGNPDGRSDEDDYLAARDALLEALRVGELSASRLEEAADRIRSLATWITDSQRPFSSAPSDEGLAAVGGEAARRAVYAVGDVQIARDKPPVIVDTRTHLNPAAGVIAQHLQREIGATFPNAVAADSRDVNEITGSGGPVIVIMRKPSEDDLALLRGLQQVADDVVVIFTGWPHAMDRLGSRVVVTYGASTSVARVAVDHLAGRQQ